MARRSTLRASDADRELVAERLRRATAEGRLLAEELEQRLGDALSARTYGELDALVADLPDRVARRRHDRPTWVRPALALAIAIPLALMILAAVAFVVTGMLTGWVLWVALGWWFFGHRHVGCGPRHQRGLYARGRWPGSGPWRAGGAGTQAGRGSWF
ncbi:MAG: hypothetical protein DLM64_09900 [Solirubrobacterales bacterium]|nr:MAG: hypothetical protein DLM64_09900 [Solirubrobacterales bacterium]